MVQVPFSCSIPPLGKKKEPKYPGLTDLKKHKDTARTRVERKILNKKSVKRVAQAVDTADKNRFRDKFGYSFNYALRS